MAKAPWTSQALYDFMREWGTTCLVDDGAILSSDAVWTEPAAHAFAERILVNDPSKRDFLEKLKDQVSDLGDTAIQFAAELLLVHTLAIRDMGPAAKRKLVGTVLDWMSVRPEIPEAVDALLADGVARFGAGQAQRPVYVRYLLLVIQAIKRQPRERRSQLLSDPWEFRAFIDAAIRNDTMQRGALLNLLFPAAFEYALVAGDKRRIRAAFARLPGVSEAPDDDRALLLIRSELERRMGRPMNLYAPWFVVVWRQPPTAGWQAAVTWAERLLRWSEFGVNERQYKLTVAERLAEARRLLVARSDAWIEQLKTALGSPNNLTHWQWEHGPFLDWCAEQPVHATAFLERLWADEEPGRIAAALELLPADVLKGSPRLTLASVLLMGVGPERFPPYRVGVVNSFRTRVSDGTVEPTFDDVVIEDSGGGEERVYREFLDLLDTFRVRLLGQGVDLPDRLEAQGLVWWLMNGEAPKDWDEAQRHAFVEFQKGGGPAPLGLLPEISEDAAADLHLPREWLQSEILGSLEDKRQIVLYGPPGTGKTFVAKRLARDVTRGGGESLLIQFHPSYGYEDFFEGYRPVSTQHGVGVAYELVRGPLRRLAERAADDPDNPYVLIIDEINRGNIPKIFGELLFLLEYRDDQVLLQYSPEAPFGLPPNLFIIGTMNTADRSIALVDAALRRRFHFVELTPTRDPVSEVLRSWLDRHGHPSTAADAAEKLNERLAPMGLCVGPAYFMTRDGSPPDLDRVWRYSILPLLEEHFYGSGTDIEAEYGLQGLLKAAAQVAPSGEPEASPND